MASFNDFVQNLLKSTNPQGGLFTGDVGSFYNTGDAAAYYADPFRKQKEINAAKAATADLSQALQATQPTSEGGSSAPAEVNPYVDAFLSNETKADRDARMTQVSNLIGNLFGGQRNDINASSLLGLNSSAGMAAQRGAQAQTASQSPLGSSMFSAAYGYTPQELQSIATTYNISPSSQQAQMLAEQEAGMNDGSSYDGSAIGAGYSDGSNGSYW